MSKVSDDYFAVCDKFIGDIENALSDIEIKGIGVDNKARDIDQKIDTMTAELTCAREDLAIARRERDEALARVKIVLALEKTAREELEEAKNLIAEVDIRERVVRDREERVGKEATFRSRDAIEFDRMKRELEALRDNIRVKEDFVKKEQALLYDKQKSLEVREVRIKKTEDRLRAMMRKKVLQ